MLQVNQLSRIKMNVFVREDLLSPRIHREEILIFIEQLFDAKHF